MAASWVICAFAGVASSSAAPRSVQYQQVQQQLAHGWNTWDVNSVITHVLLPDGLAIRISLKYRTTDGSDSYLADALIGRQGNGVEQVVPGPHTWNGSYTELRLSWRGQAFEVLSAHDGADEVLLVSPLIPEKNTVTVAPEVVFSVGYLWGRTGNVRKLGDRIHADNGRNKVEVYIVGTDLGHADVPVTEPYFSADLSQPIGLSTGKMRNVREIRAAIDRARRAYDRMLAQFGLRAAAVDAIETTLGWDTIYEPEEQRVLSPVSRVWSVNWGGYVVFEWDNFFAASMAAIGDRNLAYANALETLRGETPQGFVPNYVRGFGWKSTDRSEPPVGALTVLNLYRRFHDRWFIEDAYAPLMKWNRWWAEHRETKGYLAWGSDGENEPRNPDDNSRGTLQAAKFESGLDNSPMYDDASYDAATHRMLFADVGLISMYIVDCDALAEIAGVLAKTDDAKELRQRGAQYRESLRAMWDDTRGIFLNRNLLSDEFSLRLSPTNFYPLLAKAATPGQADRMIQEHLLNSKEFWGDWILPSIARDDPAYNDQYYWRGRVWAPMNYLVYLGLRNYPYPSLTKEFARKSMELFRKQWSANRHVNENYNAISGIGDDLSNSDRFYHWGALLAFIEFVELSAKVK
jgi:hypothetical protein